MGSALIDSEERQEMALPGIAWKLKLPKLSESRKYNLWFVLSIAITLSLFLLLAWFLLYSGDMILSFQEHELAVQRLSGELLRYTKSLEMSANMAAATGDLKWEIDYRDHRERLDSLFLTIPELVETPEVMAEIDRIREYRSEIDIIENEALQLVARGTKRRAEELLAGWIYTRNQLNIIVATENLASLMNQHISRRIEEVNRLISVLLTSLIIGTGVLAVTWYITISIWRVNVRIKEERDEDIKYLSYHDSLTGIYNRAYLEEEMHRLDEQNYYPVSLILADLNGLKTINDTFGHDEGDRFLKRAVALLKKLCRNEDLLGRWGGDEFVILLPGADSEAATAIGNRISEACQESCETDFPTSIAAGWITKKGPGLSLTHYLKSAEDMMYKQKTAESGNVRAKVINFIQNRLADKSFENIEHVKLLMHWALLIGRELNLTDSEIERLKLLAEYHDLGMVAVSEEILVSTKPLTEYDRAEIEKHPETGYRIARSAGQCASVASEILAHHEKWDGSGYPGRIACEEIPLLARIIALADAVAVMESDRPYSASLSRQEIIAELKCCAGSHFDPELTGIMIRIIENDQLS